MPLNIIGLSNGGQTSAQLYPSGIVLIPKRGIVAADGTIVVPQATIEEKHTDDLEITEHPVEIGASITDHAFKHPSEIVVQMGFSNTPSLLSGNDKYDNPLNVNDVYQTLLDLQEQRVLLSIFSARRNYDDMLIKSLAVTNDAKTENALFITVAFKQIILVSTRIVRLRQNVQANPAQTTGATNLGTIKTKAPKGKIGN